MTRRTRPLAAARTPLACALGLALVALSGCGRKALPKPPPQIIPAATQDLKVQQRGSELILEFAYPQTTIGGLPLGELQGVQLWELPREVFPFGAPEPEAAGEEAEEGEDEGAEAEAAEPGDEEVDRAEAPAGAGPAEEAERRERRRERQQEAQAAAARGEVPGEFQVQGEEDFSLPALGFATEATEVDEVPLFGPRIFVEELSGQLEATMEIDPLEFASAARVRLTLEGAELESSVIGDRVVVRFPVETPERRDQIEGWVFAVKTISEKGLGSPFSNLARLAVRPTPPPPADFELEPGDDGVELRWSTGLEEGDFKGFHVYRRSARERAYGPALRRLPPTVSELVDGEARFGESYIYAVATILVDYPLVETALSTEREVDYQDRFAPPAPKNVVALAEVGSVRVLWDASDASDVAGYFIERREEGGEWEALNAEPSRQLELTDTRVASGRTYRYRVSAIDQIGNRGDPSPAAEARVP